MNKKNTFKINKGVDLLKKFKNEPEPLVLWNTIIEGSSGLITGVGKTGKTTFAENLAISIAVGRKSFFNSPINGGPKRVLFLNLEEKLRRIYRRNRKQILSLDEKEYALFEKNYFVKPDDFPEFLNDENDWMIVREYIKTVDPDVIFMDSLTHMFVGEIERSATAQQFIQNYKKYILSFDKTTFIIHHNTKGNDKPMGQDDIAGSRVILQEFDFALGFANIPTREGGNYSCMLFNKDAEKCNNDSTIYKFNENYWIESIGIANKFDLYAESSKTDGRYDHTNRDLILEHIVSRYSQGSQSSTTREMMNSYVSTNTMSKQTYYDSINYLIENDKIEKLDKGVYAPVINGDIVNEVEDEE